MRVVLDTCVVVSAFRSARGASSQLLRLVADGQLTALVTPALFLEYEEVLKRPEQRAVSGLSISQIDGLLAAMANASEGVEVRFTWRPQLIDPDDELVLDAALNGRADAVVTFNIADFISAAPRFGLAVTTPNALLEELRHG